MTCEAMHYTVNQNLKSTLCVLHAVMLVISGTLLLYTAIIAPAQIFLWEFKEEECNVFPTLYFDIFVDLFFMVSLLKHQSSAIIICNDVRNPDKD